MKLLTLKGSAVLSEFRMVALTKALQETLNRSGDIRVEANYIYLLELADELDQTSLERVRALLSARCFDGFECGFYVMPRKGTISPWSSRAAIVLENCGVSRVKRVERGVRMLITLDGAELSLADLTGASDLLHDRMREGLYANLDNFFERPPAVEGVVFDLLAEGISTLEKANADMGLALSAEEVEYLHASYSKAGRNPTDTELVMFAQVNSEHCRHKIFNADWIVDGERQDMTLFEMIKNTHKLNPEGTLVAYADNSGVVEGFRDACFAVDGASGKYRFNDDQIDIVMKVETHNHPTAISPFPGASTGVGGEIRDEAATGSGSKAKAGLSGLIVSNLNVPGFAMPWEKNYADFPEPLATPLSIMLEAPLGGADFGNAFGRPQLCGFFRTYEEMVGKRYIGYHKPIMLAGGMGSVYRDQVHKKSLKKGDLIAQLGGPAMLIGLGGGAASSMDTSGKDESLDFDSVQRGDAEIQRRCQEVIDACVAMGGDNPIISIHDVGAGGLSNACPELVQETGATFDLRAVPCDDSSMSPMEIWCCEAQERYVLAIAPRERERFENICKRERCPAAFIGVARDDQRLVVDDSLFSDRPIDMELNVLLGKPPKMLRDVKSVDTSPPPLDLTAVKPMEALERVLRLPVVADKTFLIAPTDRSAGGMVRRDQMCGPYQLPVADSAVTITGYTCYTGETMATGERAPIALLDGPASARVAVGEALTNIACSWVGGIGNVKLSANWMCACGEDGEDARLYNTVKCVGMQFCPALGISVPVGKDSLSMRAVWEDDAGVSHNQRAPLSLIVSAFSPVLDVRKSVTPDFKPGDSALLLIDLGRGLNRLGASALAQVYNQVGRVSADMRDAALLKAFFEAMQELVEEELVQAYHDRSDGGVVVTLAEMAFSGGRGVKVNLPGTDAFAALFSEELGAVVQVAVDKLEEVVAVLKSHGLAEGVVHRIGEPTDDRAFEISVEGETVILSDITWLRRKWSALTCRMQALRDNPDCAWQDYDNGIDESDAGMSFKLTYDPDEVPRVRALDQPPKVAVLREQGMHGQIETAAAFTLAGFHAIDVHMTDLLSGDIDLLSFNGLVVSGSSSYGDVLGAGKGWAHSILYNGALADIFKKFFDAPDTFTLGVCNGCQMLSQLKGLIPGAERWPDFKRNLSEQFEARYTTVEILKSPSIFLKGMWGARVPIVASHAEGYVEFADVTTGEADIIPVTRYVDSRGDATERYPWNPDGSRGGLNGLTTTDGRVTIMMPHPQRGFRSVQLSYKPEDVFVNEAGPWMRMFHNARVFCDK